jgi:hypothetical protein
VEGCFAGGGVGGYVAGERAEGGDLAGIRGHGDKMFWSRGYYIEMVGLEKELFRGLCDGWENEDGKT